MSVPWWQCVAVAWNRTAQGTSKNEKNPFCPGQGVVHRQLYGRMQYYYCVNSLNTYVRVHNHVQVHIISILTLNCRSQHRLHVHLVLLITSLCKSTVLSSALFQRYIIPYLLEQKPASNRCRSTVGVAVQRILNIAKGCGQSYTRQKRRVVAISYLLFQCF